MTPYFAVLRGDAPTDCAAGRGVLADQEGAIRGQTANLWQGLRLAEDVWRDHDAYDVDLVCNYAGEGLKAEAEGGLLPPIHPGEILQHDIMRPHMIGVDELGWAVGVTSTPLLMGSVPSRRMLPLGSDYFSAPPRSCG